MLPDWYFCCCLSAGPDTTARLLTILAALEDPDSDARSVVTACDDLLRAESWYQIYAVPRALELIRRRPALRATIVPSLRSLFNEVLAMWPVDPREAREAGCHLVDLVLDEAPVHELLTALAALAAHLDPGARSDLSAPPYLDLRDFPAEVIVLSVLADRLGDARAAPLIKPLLESGQSLHEAIERALSGRCGRLALLLAVRVAGLDGRWSADDLAGRLRGPLQRGGAVEPDLLRAYADVLYLDAVRPGDAAAVLDELITLRHLREVWPSAEPERNADGDHRSDLEAWSGFDPLRRMGCEPSWARAAMFSTVCWQVTLCALAARLDAAALAIELGTLWQRQSPRALSVRCPPRERDAWCYQLEGLLHVGGHNVRIAPSRSDDVEIPAAARWMLVSPWIARDDRGDYPSTRMPEALIRLLASARLAIQLLRGLPDSHAGRDTCLRLLVHTSDLLARFEPWIDYLKGEHARLPLALTGLARFCKQQVTQVGTGRLTAVAPADFVRLLSKPMKYDPKGSFQLGVLPDVLVDWITDAFPGAIDGSGRGRWLDEDLMRAVCAHHRGDVRASRRADAALIERFLCPSSDEPTDRAFDWRTSETRDRRPQQWRVDFKEILLTPRDLPPTEWHRPDWPEPNNPKLIAQLARALERLDALGEPPADPIEAQPMASWRTEWSRLLGGINHRIVFNRFLRVRLVELIDRPALRGDPEGQELLALTVLEYGHPYEIKRLLETVLFGDAPVTDARRRVQGSVLRAICREFAASGDAAQRALPRDDELDRAATGELVAGAVARLVWSDRAAAETVQLARARARLTSELRVETAKLELRGRSRGIALGDVAIPEWAVRGVVVDPNRQSATVFHADFDLKGARDLFSLSRLQLEKLRDELAGSRRTCDVVGVVAGVDSRPDRPPRCLINVGLPEYFSMTLGNDAVGIEPGAMVTVPIAADAGGWYWPSGQPHRLSSRVRPGDTAELTIEERWEGGRWISRVPGLPRPPDRLLWEADASRAHLPRERQPGLAGRRPILVTYDGDGHWLPFDHDLIDLLVASRDGGAPIVLTLIDWFDDPVGERCYRFARQPGENYVLGCRWLTASAAAALAHQVPEADGASGLLVGFVPEFDRFQTRLRLALDGEPRADAALAQRYPDLRLPFDDRNLRWRELLERPEGLLAVRNGRDWFYTPQLEVPGFPPVRIQWTASWPSPGATVAEFVREQWGDEEQRAAVVRAEALRENAVTVEDPDLPQFCKDWVRIQPGDRLRVRKLETNVTGDPEWRGYVAGFTTENLRVRIEAESLALDWLDPRKLPPGVTIPHREVEVIQVEWFLHRSELEIDPDQLGDEVYDAGWCDGVIVGVSERGGNHCRVLWLTGAGDDPVLSTVTVGNMAQVEPTQGNRISGFRGKYQMHGYRLRCRALWTVESIGSVADGLYIGEVDHEAKRYGVVEVEPSRLALVPPRPDPALGTAQQLRSVGGGFHWQEGAFRVYRALLQGRSRVLGGHYRRGWPIQGDAVVDAVELRLQQSTSRLFPPGDPDAADDPEPPRFQLRRFFVLRHVRRDESEDEDEDQADADSEAAWLREYLTLPAELRTPLSASARTERRVAGFRLGTNRVPSNGEWTRWSSFVPLAPGDGPFVTTVDYGPSAKICLFEDDAGWVWATLRRVPPCTFENLEALLGVPVGSSVEVRLFYVGCETVDPFHGEKYAETRVRFERARGETVLLPRRRVENRHSMFHGDLITRVTLLRAGDGQLRLRIDEVDLRFNQARTLYKQRRDYRFIHVLDVTVHPALAPATDAPQVPPSIDVDKIEGLDDAGVGRRSFERVHARLTPASEDAMAARAGDRSRQLRIFARLDCDEFKKSEGRRVMFDHVRWAFGDAPGGPAWQADELLSLEAGQITESENDVHLELGPPSSLDRADVAAEAPPLRLGRRTFSVREKLLGRVLARLGQQALAGQSFLARIDRNDQGLPRASLLLVPARPSAALASELRRSGTVYAAVVRSEAGTTRLELRPSLLVELAADEIEVAPPDLERGAIVRVDPGLPSPSDPSASPRFRLVRAAFGDARYVPRSGGRPAVVLPKTDLIKSRQRRSDPSLWENNNFTVGGLESLTASIGCFDRTQGLWGWPGDEDGPALMAYPHPKVVRLGVDAKGKLRVALPEPDWPVGRLEVTRDLAVCYLPLHDGLGREPIPLHWQHLTFADEPCAETARRIAATTVCFHDRRTAHWGADETVWTDVAPRRLTDGPLFFHEQSPSDLRLRYGEDWLLRYGLPVDELLRTLRDRPDGQGTFHVAAVSRAEEGGLWIELAPGRLVEVPGPLLALHLHGRPQSLESMWFDGFAAGDIVDLALFADPDDPFEVDRVALLDWRPGVRAALGRRCVLPAGSWDGDRGCLPLGAGRYQLILPWTDGPVASAVALHHDNGVQPVRFERDRPPWPPGPGDVLLLTVEPDGELAAAGLPGLRPFPGRGEPGEWTEDPLGRYLVGPRADQPTYPRIRELVHAAGGSLPVTVEDEPDRDWRLPFSLRHLREASRIPDGKTTIARALAPLRGTGLVLLACGGGLVPMAEDRLVSGLPATHTRQAVMALCQGQHPIWLRGGDDGPQVAGLRADRDDILAEAIHVVAAGSEPPGLICRSVDSLRLYWMPGAKAAWATLSSEQLQRVFIERPPFRTRRTSPAEQLSILDAPEVRKEHAGLAVGNQLVVRALVPAENTAGGARQYLVESVPSRVILMCQLYGRSELDEPTNSVEVILRSTEPPAIVVAPPGSKPSAFDLPVWMMTGDQIHRQEVQDYQTWRAEPPDLAELRLASEPARLAQLGVRGLQRLMCHLMNLEEPPPPQLAHEVVRTWWRLQKAQPELFAPYLIMATLLLRELGEGAAVEAVECAQELGQRALRSMHAEVVASFLAQREAGDDLAARFEHTRRNLARPDPRSPADDIRQFCRAVDLRGVRHLRPLAASLTAALGETSAFEPIRNGAAVTGALATLHAVFGTVPPGYSVGLTPAQEQMLRNALERINRNNLDIVLLDPLRMWRS
jgi:hypothetical protein